MKEGGSIASKHKLIHVHYLNKAALTDEPNLVGL